MRTLVRVLLLVVGLGLGIVRDRLMKWELVSICGLSLMYFGSSATDHILRGIHYAGTSFHVRPTQWSLIELIANIIFILWIHFAMVEVMDELMEKNQTVKFKMYLSLTKFLLVFFVFFLLMMIFSILKYVIISLYYTLCLY